MDRKEVVRMSEVRLIDANALKEELKKALDFASATAYIRKLNSLEKTDLVKLALNIIDNAPTVEQEVYMTGKDYDFYIKGYKNGRKDFERPKGKWIYKYKTCKCSVCGFETVIDVYNYCPMCGADMRGGAENE